MKLIEPVRPVTSKHREELQHEYELEKQKLIQSIESLRVTLKENATPAQLIARFPFESALMMAFLGFAVGQKVSQRFSRMSDASSSEDAISVPWGLRA